MTLNSKSNENTKYSYIRGVNVGGWLLAERFITPYLFAVNSCHLQGDLCWYEGQVGAPKDAEICSSDCSPVQTVFQSDSNADFHPRHSRNYYGYPIDELTLGQAFVNKEIGRKYMERHWDTFVNKQDLIDLREAGVTHMRVPMSYWIRGDVQEGEPWIDGGWPYFVRFAKWAREIGGLEIWADLHGAPGSENGFDNSGHYKGASLCDGWEESTDNVMRTLDIIQDIAHGIVEEGLTDVVTGFGLLNEPFNCDRGVLRRYYNDAFDIVRKTMGENVAVFIGDNFNAWQFNDGWWTDTNEHYNTYLDTHPYHIFFEKGRAFTPKQHIAYVCRHNAREVNACCWDDHPTNSLPSPGISRIVGEWSAAYDMLPTAMAPFIMEVIAKEGVAPLLNRTLSPERMSFMRNFVEAQMVVYEQRDTGISSGWLFWNFKMEGGAFLEWDFLRGVRQGWIPHIPRPDVASEDLYGSCLDIYNRTKDVYNLVVEEYPDPRELDWNQWQGWDANDDLVLEDELPVRSNERSRLRQWGVVSFLFICSILFSFRQYRRRRAEKDGYLELK